MNLCRIGDEDDHQIDNNVGIYKIPGLALPDVHSVHVDVCTGRAVVSKAIIAQPGRTGSVERKRYVNVY